jgi:hypothetical protein
MQFALFSTARLGRGHQAEPALASSSLGTPGIVISVDARGHSSGVSGGQKELHAIGSALQTLLGEHGLPATWGVSEPLTSPFVTQLDSGRRAISSHEVALHLANTGADATLRRSELANVLARCMSAAQVNGVRITTLFADSMLVCGNYDLLVKRGISALRNTTAPKPSSDGSARVPRQLRYGLWGYPIAHTLPSGGLVSGIEKRLLADADDPSAVRQIRVFHVSVEVAQLSSGDRAAWRVLEKSLRRIARLRTECGVRIESLRTLTARLSTVPVAAPQRSILRRAA